MSKSKRSATTTSTKKSKRSAKSTTSSVTPIGQLKRTTNRNSLNQNTWVVFRSGSSERKPMLFEARLSRDKVRCAYSRITGAAHDTTRSRRLRNY